MANAKGDSIPQFTDAERTTGSRRAGVPPGGNPTVRQRELGMRLREFRNALGLTVEEVGKELMCSATKISRLETGARRVSLRDVRDLCRVYEVNDEARVEELMDLARQAREPGWWAKFDEPLLSPLVGLEQEAVAITAFSTYWVPALLQTGEYARATIKSIERKVNLTVLEQRIEARLLRQQVLDRPAPARYRAVLDEAVLHRCVGGPAVMHAQLGKVLDRAAEEKVTVQVIPFDTGVHASTDSNFELFEFASASVQRPVVYVEGLYTNRYQERLAEIERYREAIEYLRDAALNPRDSLSLITEIRSQYTA